MPANLISDSLLSDIRQTILTVRNSPGSERTLPAQTRFEGVFSGIRLGTILAPWDKNSDKLVTQADGDGNAIVPAKTFTAKNLLADVPGAGARFVVCANVGGKWIMIAAECD